MIARDRIRMARYRRALSLLTPAEVVEASAPPECVDEATDLVRRLVPRHAPDAPEALARLLDARRPS